MIGGCGSRPGDPWFGEAALVALQVWAAVPGPSVGRKATVVSASARHGPSGRWRPTGQGALSGVPRMNRVLGWLSGRSDEPQAMLPGVAAGEPVHWMGPRLHLGPVGSALERGDACHRDAKRIERRSGMSGRSVSGRVATSHLEVAGLLAAAAGLARPGNGAEGKRKPRRFHV